MPSKITSFFRVLRKSGFYYIVNIAGLSLSFAVMLLAILIIYRELSTDRFHKNIDNIYCVGLDGKGYTPYFYAGLLKDQLPGVSSFTRVQLWDLKFNVLRYGDNPPLDLDQIIRADTNFFTFFTFSFISGDPRTCLDKPESLVITESAARKLFGDDEAMGKVISYNKGQMLLTVTAVVKDPPFNSSMKFNAVMSVNGLPVIYPPYRQPGAFFWSFETFVQLDGTVQDLDRLNSRASEIFIQSISPETIKEAQDIFKSKFQVQLTPFKEVYFNTGYQTSLKKGDIKQVYLFSVIGFLIILVALVNYVNLSNACATLRIKEVIMRKILGSGKRSLLMSLLGESIILSFIAVLIALIIGKILTDIVNHQQVFSTPLKYFDFRDQAVILLAGSIFTGIAGGLYPALKLARIDPSPEARHNVLSGAIYLRKILLVFQFFVTSSLLICALVISRQYKCMTDNSTGFDSENIVYMRMGGQLKRSYLPFTDRLKEIPMIMSVANARYNFIGGRNPGLSEFICNGQNVNMDAISFTADTGFMELLGLRLASGNTFREHDNIAHKLIINETALKLLGNNVNLTDITLPDKVHGVTWQVVGVVKDFNTRSMQYPVSPYIFYFVPGDADMDGLYIKIAPGADCAETIDLIKKAGLEFSPDEPVTIEFLDDARRRIYMEDDNRRKVFVFFSAFTILISCLGLYALSGFMLERRTRETGIRKVYGADEHSLFAMLASGFMKIVITGYFFALPSGWYLMDRWLQNYALKTKLSFMVFLAPALIIFIISFLSVSLEIRKTCSKNVTDIIRHE